jgi:hypothetical protein
VLPKRLRRVYCELMTSVYVDVGDKIDVLAEVQLSFNWNRIDKLVCRE